MTAEGEASARLMQPVVSTTTSTGAHQSPVAGSTHGGTRGVLDQAADDEDSEWDYGDYEGLTTTEIRRSCPDWTVWSGPCPGGETEEVARRARRVIDRALSVEGDVALYTVIQGVHRDLAGSCTGPRSGLRARHGHHLGPRFRARVPDDPSVERASRRHPP